MSSLTCDGFSHGDAFLGSLMRQHGSAYHIAHGIDIGQIRAAMAIYFDISSIIQLQSDIFRTQSGSIWNPADRDNEFIHFQFLYIAFIRAASVYSTVILLRRGFDPAYFDSGLYNQP